MACAAQGLWCAAYGNGTVAIRLLQHLSLDTPVVQPNKPLPEEIILAAPAATLQVRGYQRCKGGSTACKVDRSASASSEHSVPLHASVPVKKAGGRLGSSHSTCVAGMAGGGGCLSVACLGAL